MNVLIRTTAQGTEYWNTEEKRTLFVPAGDEPGFEVAQMGVDLADGPDSTAVPKPLKDMKVEQLREHATSIGVEIPDDVKKKDDIIKLLS